MINNENYIVIQGWMINELNLKGNELLIYAIIYGFSQDEENYFEGSRQYLADWTNSTKMSVDKCLKSLIEKKYIEKKEKYINNIKFCMYKSLPVVNKVYKGSKQSLPGGSKQSLYNNIDINNIDINNIELGQSGQKTQTKTEIEKINKKEKEKKPYGEFKNVYLTDEQLEKLKIIYENKLNDAIERLSSYIESKGKDKYKNHYAVLGKSNWVYKDIIITKQNKNISPYQYVN